MNAEKDRIVVGDIMTREVISVRPETPLVVAHRILSKKNFDGVPVVDARGRLQGILTEYDLIAKGSAMHLPTFQQVILELHIRREDRSTLQQEISELRRLTVKDVMNDNPLILEEETSFAKLVGIFKDHHRVNPIPVVDKDGKVIGVVSRFDVLKVLQLF